MSCSCGGSADAERDRVAGIFEELDLRRFFEQAERSAQPGFDAARHLDKADRAAALGLGGEVVAMHRGGAERSNRMAQRELRAALNLLDERMARGDWAEIVERARATWNENDGATAAEDFRQALCQAIYERDGVSGADAREAVALLDESIERVAGGDLNGIARLLRERLSRALEERDNPEMGRQPASPLSINQWICLGVAIGLSVIAIIGCILTWFCGCCWIWILIAWGLQRWPASLELPEIGTVCSRGLTDRIGNHSLRTGTAVQHLSAVVELGRLYGYEGDGEDQWTSSDTEGRRGYGDVSTLGSYRLLN